MIAHAVVEIADGDASIRSRPRNASGEQQREGAMPRCMLLIYGPPGGGAGVLRLRATTADLLQGRERLIDERL
jgi:hypothetical protein